MTNLAMFVAAGMDTDLADLYASWTEMTLSAGDVLDAAKKINANLAALYNANGLDPATYNFFQAVFSVNGPGIDGVYDALTIALNADGVTVDEAITIAIQGGAIMFDVFIDTSEISFDINTGGGGGGNAGDIPDNSDWELEINSTTTGF